MTRSLKWTDTLDIAIELAELHPEVDPKTVRFTDLMRWTMELPGFAENETHCGEKILEAIQMAWIEEVQ
jgi:FeS assembly protein IscX